MKPDKHNISNTSVKIKAIVVTSVLLGVLPLISSIVTLALSFVGLFSGHKKSLIHASLIFATIFVGFFICAALAKYLGGSERKAIAESHRKSFGVSLKESKQKIKQIDKKIKDLNKRRDLDLSLLDMSYCTKFKSANANNRETRSIEKEFLGRRKATLENYNEEIKLLLDRKIKYQKCVKGYSISSEQIERILRDPLDVNAKVSYFDRVEFSAILRDSFPSDGDVNCKREFVLRCLDPLNPCKSALSLRDYSVVHHVAWSGKMGKSEFVNEHLIYKENNSLVTGMRARRDIILRKSTALYAFLPSDRVRYSTCKEEKRQIIKSHLENYYMGILCSDDPCSIYSLKAAEIEASGGNKTNPFSDVKVFLPIIEVKRFADYGFKNAIEASLEVFCEKFGLNSEGELKSACSLEIGAISVMTGNDKIDDIIRDRGYMNGSNYSLQLMLPFDVAAKSHSVDRAGPNTNQSGVHIKRVDERIQVFRSS